MGIDRLYLAGAAGAGKTTVAQILGKRLGLPVHEVEARECWPLADVDEREECFARVFEERMLRGNGVYSNHLLTVYGYAVALGASPWVAETALRRAALYSPVVVLVAGPECLRRRIASRMERERDRRLNVVEGEIETHLRAQAVIVDAARELGIPVLDTSHVDPEDVAGKVLGKAATRF